MPNRRRLTRRKLRVLEAARPRLIRALRWHRRMNTLQRDIVQLGCDLMRRHGRRCPEANDDGDVLNGFKSAVCTRLTTLRLRSPVLCESGAKLRQHRLGRQPKERHRQFARVDGHRSAEAIAHFSRRGYHYAG